MALAQRIGILASLFCFHCSGAAQDVPQPVATPAGGGPKSDEPQTPGVKTTAAIGDCPRGTWCSHTALVTPADFRGVYSPETPVKYEGDISPSAVAPAWAVTDTGSIYQFNGGSWSLAWSPARGEKATGTAVAGSSATDVWVAIIEDDPENVHADAKDYKSGTSHLMHWDGRAWSRRPSSEGRIFALASTGPNEVLIAGDRLERETTTSPRAYLAGSFVSPFVDLAAVSQDVVWAVTRAGKVQRGTRSVDSASHVAFNFVDEESNALPAAAATAIPVGLLATGEELDYVWKESGVLHWSVRDAQGWQAMNPGAVPSCGGTVWEGISARDYGRRLTGHAPTSYSGDGYVTELVVAEQTDCPIRLNRARKYDAKRSAFLAARREDRAQAGVTAISGNVRVGSKGRIWGQFDTPFASNADYMRATTAIATVSKNELWTLSSTSWNTNAPNTLQHYVGGRVESFFGSPPEHLGGCIGTQTILAWHGELYGLVGGEPSYLFSKWDGSDFRPITMDCAGCGASPVEKIGKSGAEELWTLGRQGGTTIAYRWTGSAWEAAATVPGTFFQMKGTGANDLYLWGQEATCSRTAPGKVTYWDGAQARGIDEAAQSTFGFRVDWLSNPGNAWLSDTTASGVWLFERNAKRTRVDFPDFSRTWQVTAPGYITTSDPSEHPIFALTGSTWQDTRLPRDHSLEVIASATAGDTIFVAGSAGMVLEYTP